MLSNQLFWTNEAHSRNGRQHTAKSDEPFSMAVVYLCLFNNNQMTKRCRRLVPRIDHFVEHRYNDSLVGSKQCRKDLRTEYSITGRGSRLNRGAPRKRNSLVCERLIGGRSFTWKFSSSPRTQHNSFCPRRAPPCQG